MSHPVVENHLISKLLTDPSPEPVSIMPTKYPVFLALLLFIDNACSGLAPPRYQTVTLTVGGTTQHVRIPDGYSIEVLNEDLDGPRLFTFAGNGDLLIGSRSGRIYRLPPPYRQAQVLIRLHGYPHSLALRANELLIARTDGLYTAPYALGQTRISPDSVRLLARLPGGSGHNSRSVAVGPDGRVYLSLGISGNCSDQYLSLSKPFSERRGGVLVLDESGREPVWRAFATGLRNPVGFDWHPVTGVMYAGNNGPDHWGFDLPPEYFSRLTPGSFHGMPWFQYDGNRIQPDRCIGSQPPQAQSEVVKPVATFPARSAPMGVAFATVGALQGDAIVALHGSWATRPHGRWDGKPASRRAPKLVVVRFDNGKAQRVDDLITGMQLSNGDRWARPIGVGVGPDGAIYFTSDSGANALFRLRESRGN